MLLYYHRARSSSLDPCLVMLRECAWGGSLGLGEVNCSRDIYYDKYPKYRRLRYRHANVWGYSGYVIIIYIARAIDPSSPDRGRIRVRGSREAQRVGCYVLGRQAKACTPFRVPYRARSPPAYRLSAPAL